MVVASRTEAWIETLNAAASLNRDASPLAQRRGSKPPQCSPVVFADRRLSHRGVDRNCLAPLPPPNGTVASRTEAWIETREHHGPRRTHGSPLAQRRGSKPKAGRPVRLLPLSPLAQRRGSKQPSDGRESRGHRSPLAQRRGSKRQGWRGRARIAGSPLAQRRGSKQLLSNAKRKGNVSPLAQRRGSKRARTREVHQAPASPLAQRRGSKLMAGGRRHRKTAVASRTEAWIETRARRRRLIAGRVASRTEAWIETVTRR